MSVPFKNKISVDKLLYWGILSTFFLIPIAKSPPIITGMLSIAIWLLSGKFIKDRNLWIGQDWLPPVALFVLLPWIGLLWTNDIWSGLEFALKSHFWLYAVLIATLPQYSPFSFLTAFLCGLSFNSLIAVLYYIGLISFRKISTTGLLTGYNPHISYSLLLVFGILIFSFLFRDTDSKRQKVFFITLMGMLILNLSVCIGRIGYVAIALLFPLVLYNILGMRLIRMLVVQALLIVVFLSSSTVQERIKFTMREVNLYKQQEDSVTFGLRIYMWEKALIIIKDNPIIGVGTGGFEKELEKFDGHRINQPHNSLLYMMTSFGVIGLFSIIWLFTAFFKKGWKARDSLIGFSILAFGLVLIIGSLTDTQVLSRLTATIFALLMGMTIKKGEKDEGHSAAFGRNYNKG